MTDSRLFLPQVTLCAVTSVNVPATLRALLMSLDRIAVSACKLLTDAPVKQAHPGVEVVPIRKLNSSAAYSDFLLTDLPDYISTSHCLIVQWDGHVNNVTAWKPEFLDYDYIGARWPQFGDGHDVGNGGFSLRSSRLMDLCRDPGFLPAHPEDVAIGRNNRDWLEARGIRFAPAGLADIFAAERAGDPGLSFGYHGVFNMPRAIGVEAFWEVYRELDDLGTIRPDFYRLLNEMGRGRGGFCRMLRMVADRMRVSRRG